MVRADPGSGDPACDRPGGDNNDASQRDGPGRDQRDASQRDPILVRRARYASWASTGQGVGYGLLAVAVVAFIAAFATNFPSAAVIITIVGLIGACVVLPPAIIAGYAVKAAEREERQSRRQPGR
jgi:hypothetical protein